MLYFHTLMELFLLVLDLDLPGQGEGSESRLVFGLGTELSRAFRFAFGSELLFVGGAACFRSGAGVGGVLYASIPNSHT